MTVKLRPYTAEDKTRRQMRTSMILVCFYFAVIIAGTIGGIVAAILLDFGGN